MKPIETQLKVFDRYTSWDAWHWDAWTVAWLVWLVTFLVVETLALRHPDPQHTLTAHLRPVFATQSLAYFITFGAWLWVGFHFLVDGVFVSVDSR